MLNNYIILSCVILFNIGMYAQNNFCLTASKTYPDLFNDIGGTDYSEVEEVTFSFVNGGNYFDGIVSNINGNIDFQNIYNSNPKDNQGRVNVTIKYTYENIWGNDILLESTNIIIQGDSHLSIDVPENVCQGDGFDILNYTSHQMGTFSTSNDSYLTGQNNDEILFSNNANPSTFTINWETTTNGCTFTKSDNLEIRANPVVTFPNIQTGQLLDSDNTPIQLVSSTDIPVQQKWYFGAGINISNQFIPSNAGYGTHTLSVEAQTLYGCSGNASQTVTVTHDAGTPTPPEISNYSSGFGIKDHSFNLNGDPVYSRAFHVCDGQQIDIYVDTASVQLGYDSVIVEYLFNGTPLQVGTFPALEHIQYTIPQTFGTRRDYLRTRFKSNLGVVSPNVRVSEVYVNAPNTRVNVDTICDESPVFPVLGYNNNTDYEHLYWGQGGYYSSANTSAFSTGFFDLFNNPISISQSSTWSTSVPAGNKSRTIVRSEKTYLPNGNVQNETYNTFRLVGGFYQPHRQFPSFNNPQTCERTDTLVIVRPPIPNYNYSGDTLILAGTSVQVENTSSFSDWVSFDFYNNKGEQIGDTIIDTLFIGNGAITITAYDNYGCISDSTNFNFVSVTNDPKIGLIDSTSSGVIYPVRNGEFTFSGNTDSSTMEMHVCDGQTIDLSIDSTMLAFSSGIDSVYYFYYSNGTIDTIGQFGIYENASYTIPHSFAKRVDSITTQLMTVTKTKGEYFTAPIYVSIPLQREPTTRILNCDVTFNYNQNQFIGQNSADFIGLNQIVLNGFTANQNTFETEFRDINGNIIPYGSNYSHTLSAGTKVDTIHRKEITHLPYKGTGFSYYGKIGNPQTCELNDTILVVRPPIASYTFQGVNVVTFGTAVRHISSSQYNDYVEWNFHDDSHPYFGDTVWHVMYEIGYHDVTVKASDIYGCEDSFMDYGYIEVMDWTGIDENSDIEIKTLGNPFQNIIELEINISNNELIELAIIDLGGKVIYNEARNLSAGKNRISIDGYGLATGTYLLSVKGQQSKMTTKINKY